MAERMLVAFGRYLRMLRERRGLSLDEVEALTRAYPEPVNKAYLSRVENGKSRIAFSRMVALCRAYEYPIDAAAERLALDLEVDGRESGPDTAGKPCAELLQIARDFLIRGYRIEAYACSRDAIPIAKSSPLSRSCRNPDEQLGLCTMNTATVASRLGRFRFALTEYVELERLGVLSEGHFPVLLDRIAYANWATKDFATATRYAERALETLGDEDSHPYLSTILTTRALVHSSLGDKRRALLLYQRAFRLARVHEAREDIANILCNLAQIYFDLGRLGASRRSLAAADRIAADLGFKTISVRVRILRGEILEAQGDIETAIRVWNEGLQDAKSIRDATLTFKVKYFLYRAARNSGRPAIAKKLAVALKNLAPWIPEGTEELRLFSELIGERVPKRPAGVA